MVLGLGIGLINNLQEMFLGSVKNQKILLHIQIINHKKIHLKSYWDYGRIVAMWPTSISDILWPY